MPHGWQLEKIETLCDRIQSGGTPLSSIKEYYSGDIPFVKIEDLTNSKKNLYSTNSKITSEGLKNSSAWLVPEDSLLYAMYGSIGSIAINKIPVATNQAILGIILDKQKADLEFIYYALSNAKNSLMYHAKQSTQANLTAKIVKEFEISVPSLQEQKSIASVLSTVDSGIQKSDEAIEKTERLKQGLMQRLLTKGLGHDRFVFREELGCEIPEEWEVVRLGKIAEINKESRDPAEKPDSSFMYIDIESVENGSGLIKGVKEVFGAAAPSRARRVVHTGDVIMSTVRPYLKAFALVPPEFDNQICSTGFAVLTTTEKTTPKYILYSLFSDNVIDQCNRMMVGGQYPALNSTQVSKINLPLPLVNEQERIAEILSSVDEKLSLEKKRRERLERIKKGLMDVLLSGKKRVSVN